MKITVISVVAIAVLVATLGATSAFAISAYQSGLSHGVTDGKDSCLHPSGCHWYILDPGKGFAFHSKEFDSGYVDGFCSIDPKASSDADQASFDCDKGPSSASWVSEK